MPSGLKLWGIMTATAIVLSDDSPTLVKVAARLAKVVFHDRIQICDGADDELEAIAAYGAGARKVTFLEGNYSFSAATPVPSNTEVELCKGAIITLAGGSACNIFENSDAVGGNTNIYIHGGYLDAALEGICIYFSNVTDSRIEGMYCYRGSSGIYAVDCTNLVIEKNSLLNAEGGGIQLTTCVDSAVRGNYIKDTNPNDAGTMGWALYSYGNNRCSFIENIVDTTTLVADGGYGISVYYENTHILLANNVFYNTGDNGISIHSIVDHENSHITAIGNRVIGARGPYSILCSRSDGSIIESNEVYGLVNTGLAVQVSSYVTVVGNVINGAARGMLIGGDHYLLTGNIVINTTGTIAVRVEALTYSTFADNILDTSTNWGIYEAGATDYIIYAGNQLSNFANPFALVGIHDYYCEKYSGIFMDIQAVTANYVGSWAGTGAEQVISPGDPGWAAQPDIKRNLTVACTNNAAPSGDVVIAGVNAKGQTISETFTIVPGGTAVGNEAFATITTITIPAGVAAADTVDVGIGSKLGLSNIIYATADVYKVTRTTGGAPAATAGDYSVQGTDITVNATYDTVDMATGAGIVAGDCYAVNYRSNLNIIS